MDVLKTSFFIAYKSIIRGSKSMMILLIFILSLSFINMMFISGILNGLSSLIPRAFIDQISAHITINPQEKPQIKQFIPNQTLLRSQISTIPGIIATTRRYNLAGSLAFDKDKSGQYRSLSSSIMGIDPVQDSKVMGISKLTKYGSFLSDSDTDQILLSSALAGGYGVLAPSDLGGVVVGDKIQVTYANGIMRTYTVKGIYADNMGIYENFISTREAESILGTYDNASQILVKVDLNKEPIEGYTDKIKTMAPNLKLQTYKVALGSFGAFLDALNLIALIVSIISVAVSAVTIFVLIYVNALNKKRQIGILKAIGIKQKIIVYSYTIQSLFYTTVGLGIGSMLVFGVLYPLFLKYPIDVDFGKISLEFTLVGVLAGILSFSLTGILAGFIPSRIVAKQDILKAIWG